MTLVRTEYVEGIPAQNNIQTLPNRHEEHCPVNISITYISKPQTHNRTFLETLLGTSLSEQPSGSSPIVTVALNARQHIIKVIKRTISGTGHNLIYRLTSISFVYFVHTLPIDKGKQLNRRTSISTDISTDHRHSLKIFTL